MSVPAGAWKALSLGCVISATALAQTPTAPTEEDIRKALEADAKANAQANPPSITPSTPQAAALVNPAVRFFQSLNPDLSFIADFAAAGFSEPLEMNGDHDPHDNGFNLQALELAVAASVDPYFRFDSNIVFLQSGSEIEEAYGTTLALPYGLQIRAGKFLTRFGRFNPTHPHTWTFADQPLVIGRFFGPDGNRGVGMEVSELLPFLPWYAEVVVAAQDTRGVGLSFLQSNPDGSVPPVKQLGDLQYTGNINQFFPISDDVSLSWGISGMAGHNVPAQPSWTEILGTDIYLKYRPLTEGSVTIVSLSAEAFLRRYQVGGGTAEDTGAFAQLFWRFALRWGAAVSAEYVNSAHLDPFNIEGLQQRYKANVTFWPTEFSRLRLQYDVEPPGPNHGDVGHALFLAVEFAVGAHGAHKF
jgi:hypothetical protein